ncbi:MAG: Gfo/Idh/MocA family protein [Fimbriimonas sp.]
MAEEVRLGVAGLTHGHVWGLMDAWAKTPGVRLVAVADATPLLDKSVEHFEHAYTSWQNMLESHEFDALLVTSDNVESSEIAVQALKKGIPCMVEKAMAANAEDADRMLAAAKETGAKLMINWPLAWSAWVPELKKQIDADAIGHVFHFRFRNGHFGPKEIGCDEYFVGWLYDEKKNGGGAIADFGSYGAVLARYLFGMPETVYCVRHNTTKDYYVCDDHAVLVLKYPKRDVFLEGTWATRAWEEGANPVAYGKDGTLAVYGQEMKHHGPAGATVINVPDLPTKNPAEYFLTCIREGKEPEGILNADLCADACRILDAAIKSSASGCAEKL